MKSCLRKIRSDCKKDHPINFRLLYDVTKMEFFCNTKDKNPMLNQSFVVYEFKCPGQLYWKNRDNFVRTSNNVYILKV